MKKLLCKTAAALLTAVLLIPMPVCADSAGSAFLLDAVSGQVLYEKNAYQRSLIASTTKIMTALLVCERCNVLEQVTIPVEAVGVEGSSMYLQAGEVLTIQELLYGLMMASGNDAAVALAVCCGGSVEEFAQMMNEKAHALGLTGTHFVNPHGLDHPDHYATARDLAFLAAYAMENPVFARTVSAKTLKIGDRYLRNHNKLLWLYPQADGVKTGFTRAAGRILVSSAEKDGRRLVAVTINDPNDWQDHMHMLDDGFMRYSVKQIVSAGDRVGQLEVVGAQSAAVELQAAESFAFPLAEQETVRFWIPGTQFVYAPVAEGADAGFAYVMLGDRAIGRIRMVYAQTVEQSAPKQSGWNHWLFGG